MQSGSPSFESNGFGAEICCQQCGCRGKILRLHTIDPTHSPESKQVLLDGSFFQWECPQCGAHAEFCYPCRYFDPQTRLSAVLSPQVDEKALAEMNRRLAGNGVPGYLHRAVENFFALQELVKLRDLQLDDRAVQLLKPLIIGQLQQQGLEIWNAFFSHLQVLEGICDSPQANVLYMSQGEQEDLYSEPVLWLDVHFTDGQVQQHGLNRTAYRLCQEMLGELGPDDGCYHLYNLAWAIEFHNQRTQADEEDAEPLEEEE